MGPELLGRLVDERAAALVLYARQWCATPEDVVQDAFLKLVQQKLPPTDPVPWLYRVVRNAAISASRGAKRRRRHETAVAWHNREWFEPADGTRLDSALAAAALKSLPIEQREIIVAHLWGGLTFEQIAEVCESTSSTVHRRYVAGLTALRERLGVSCPTKPMTLN